MILFSNLVHGAEEMGKKRKYNALERKKRKIGGKHSERKTKNEKRQTSY
jgi:hypothetical protein